MRRWRALSLVLAVLAGCSSPDPARPAPRDEAESRRVSAQASATWELCDLTPVPLGPALPDVEMEGREPVHAGGYLFFFVGDDTSGQSLWVSSGTQGEGTFKIKDFPPGPTGMPPTQLIRVGERVFFSAEDADHGEELWTSDGTKAGTHMVLDLWPGPTGSFPGSFFEADGRLYFAAGDEAHGRELWTSDGTTTGTVLVADIDPGPEGTNPDRLTRSSDGSLYFIAQVQVFYTVVMKLTPGSAPVELMRMSSEGAVLGGPTAVGRRVFFVMGDMHRHNVHLLVTDGGPPVLVGDFASTGEMRALSGKLLFAASTDMDGMDMELWRSDGTAKGTKRVKDIRVGEEGSLPAELTVLGSHLYFSADDGLRGREVWVSDGTEPGTGILTDLEPGAEGSIPEQLAADQGNLFFSAQTSGRGREAWVSNGTTRVTLPLDNVASGASDAWPRSFVRSGWDVFFTAVNDQDVRRLWAVPFRPEGRCPTQSR
ncbi:hypothetical protein JY651_14700 [Pyxidicoccus parkwayensis]|uniref:Lipoprotein n=1 Tax=Pyxidicoccus parkwayensis TaxID=2813578 RepID=A0ABX7P6G9_9BACT|nr:ELWxxDGT repeat protein [Pyxidicoccus parkwaysis]QSQ26094.1 hypothetical protein JY651_14700 [Pyxidicoccus parkwaysis]